VRVETGDGAITPASAGDGLSAMVARPWAHEAIRAALATTGATL
jgi:hypothetical protein